MNESSPIWPQGPWSPLGYKVVEVADDEDPAEKGHPLPGRCPPKREPSPPPEPPETAEGDRFIELALEETAANQAPPASVPTGGWRSPRPQVRWSAIAGGVAVLIVVVLALTLRRRSAEAAEDGLSDGPVLRETFGTAVGFVRNPAAAARAAAREQKLLCLLHVSGSFEEAKFT